MYRLAHYFATLPENSALCQGDRACELISRPLRQTDRHTDEAKTDATETAVTGHLRPTPDEGQTWFVIFVPEGSYDIEDINRVIQQKTRQNGHSNQIAISANTNTLKAVLMLENGCHVDFRPPDSMSSVLGFNNDLYTTDY